MQSDKFFRYLRFRIKISGIEEGTRREEKDRNVN